MREGTDKVERVSVISEYEKGGLRKIVLECMVKLLRLGWDDFLMKSMDHGKVSYTIALSPLGGFLFLACNYNISDYTIPSQFYYELASWWTEFRLTFATEKDWTNIIWNNCEIRINNKPVYCKNYYEAGIVCTQDLLFNLNIADTYNHLSKKKR